MANVVASAVKSSIQRCRGHAMPSWDGEPAASHASTTRRTDGGTTGMHCAWPWRSARTRLPCHARALPVQLVRFSRPAGSACRERPSHAAPKR